MAKSGLSIRERFERLAEVQENGCWRWLGTIDRGGYGKFYVNGRGKLRAHRVAFELYKSEIEEGRHVCHSCDNRWCVNPAHLWLGSARDNMHDALRKGRLTGSDAIREYQKGAANQNARLDAEAVMRIRELVESGVTHREVAEMFGVRRQAIGLIASGKRWNTVSA